MFWIWFFIYAFIFGFLSSLAVKEKNRDQFSWFLIGFFLGIFGLIAALIVSKLPKKNSNKMTVVFNPNYFEKKCPDCAEMIKIEARVCRFCGRKFSEEEVQRNIDEEKSKNLVNDDDLVAKDNSNFIYSIDKSKLKEDRKTLKRITVDRIDERTGRLFFTYEWRKGIKYSLIGQAQNKLAGKVIIYAGGNFFYCNEDDLI